MTDVGILSYGIYIPFYRLKVESISEVWGKKAENIKSSLGVSEKSVAGFDEDSVTLAYEAGKNALIRGNIQAKHLEAILVGSESHPYAVNPTSTIIGEFLGVGRRYLATDLEFACKAGTSALISVAGLIASEAIKTGLIVGTDCAQAKPHDVLEYTAASAAGAFILGKNTEKCPAQIIDFSSVSSDTPDFWRRDGVRFPSHGGRFTGEPAYFSHVEEATRNILSKTNLKPGDFNYCIFHMPNGKFPRLVAKRLGFTYPQILPSLIVDYIGNPYSASALIGLSAVLDIAKKNDLVLMVSYGSGAGSDAIVMKVNTPLTPEKNHKLRFIDMVARKQYISYVDYLKFGSKI